MINMETKVGLKGALATGLVAVVAGGTGGYFAGFDTGKNYVALPPEPPVFESSYAENLPEPEEIRARLGELEARIADLRLKSDNLQKPQVAIDMESIRQPDLAMLESRLESMPPPEDLARAKFLADPRADIPRTPSGVSVEKLNNLQRETGISPEEVENLMQGQIPPKSVYFIRIAGMLIVDECVRTASNNRTVATYPVLERV